MGLLLLILGVSVFFRRDGDPRLYPVTEDAAVPVYILDNGFHTDLVVPRQILVQGRGPLAQAVQALPSGDWVSLGWGDARFFVEEGPVSERWGDGLRALLRPNNPSAVRMSAADLPTTGYSADEVQRLNLSVEGVDRLVGRVDASLKTGAEGQPLLLTHRLSDGAYFYHSREGFWLGHLCNHWTMEVLHSAGITVWPWRVMTSGEVMRTARLAARQAGA